MTRRLVVVMGGVGLTAFIVGSTWPTPVGFAVTLLLILLGTGAAVALETRRVQDLVAQLGTSQTADQHRPVTIRGGRAWQQLASVLNTRAENHQRHNRAEALEGSWARELVNSLVQPALLFSDEDRLLAANDAACRLLGIPSDVRELTVVQAVGSTALATAVRSARATGGPVSVEVDHGELALRAVVSAVGQEMLLVISDRTQELRVEELRRNFVVNASHELKTPVTGIQTLAEALATTIERDPTRAPALVARLNGEAERLARLVRELLDLRRLEELSRLERVPVDLARLVRQVVAENVDHAEESEVELSVDAPDRAGLLGMPSDLELLVQNLVSNAIQYNRPGGSVVVHLTSREDTQTLSVRDTEIGIPQHDLSRIFERFYRVDLARSRETGGTGLGLAIVRHAAERHGGTVQVESLLGEGTTFTVTLPTGSEPGTHP